MPHNEIKEIVESGVPVHLFVNPVEYHGPHLSLNNDRILSEVLAEKLHSSLCDEKSEMPYITGGNINFGSDPCEGKGSIGITYTKLKYLIEKQARSLAELGVKRVIYHTFHGSPFHSHAIHCGIKVFEKYGIRAINCFDLVVSMIIHFDKNRYKPLRDLLPSEKDYDNVSECLSNDTHAGFFETSVSLFLAPETVSSEHKELPPCPEIKIGPILGLLVSLLHKAGMNRDELEMTIKVLKWTALKPFPGYTGIPGLASKEVGEFYVNELILPRYHKACIEVLWEKGEVPKTPIGWTRFLSSLVGGRK